MRQSDAVNHPGPAREGRTARVPRGARVYAVGDIHGRADLLRALHAVILRDADRAAGGSRRTIVYLGDYIDRGADSRGVVEMLAAAPLPGFEHVHLLGNHDHWLLEFVAGRGSGIGWLLNGGDRTLESYGVVLPYAPAAEADLDPARAALRRRLPARHMAFFEGLAPSHREGDYLFVHAGIRPGVALERQSPDDLMWIREEFLDSDLDHGSIVVHGHTPATEVQSRPNRIGIDTGAFATGRLTCLVLEDDERRVLQT